MRDEKSIFFTITVWGSFHYIIMLVNIIQFREEMGNFNNAFHRNSFKIRPSVIPISNKILKEMNETGLFFIWSYSYCIF